MPFTNPLNASGEFAYEFEVRDAVMLSNTPKLMAAKSVDMKKNIATKM
jgi:hypothetical protein